jgi:hypothetical protein
MQSTEISRFVCLQILVLKAHRRREKRNKINAPSSPGQPKCAHRPQTQAWESGDCKRRVHRDGSWME